jgi:uncharacterized protein (DUF58 family)
LIYPTRLAVLLAGAIAPLALLIALAAPGWWPGGLILLAVLLACCALDMVLGTPARAAELSARAPYQAGIGERFAVTLHVRLPAPRPRAVQLALGVSGPAEAPFGLAADGEPEKDGFAAEIALQAERRGTVHIDSGWIRWRAPLGLVWKQRQLGIGGRVLITPNIRQLREAGAQMVNREAMFGIKAQMHLGEGAEFEALADYRQGMDRRAIDWKQSARHTRLIAKEYRTERNNNVVMALDAGRAMCEPIDGVPRVDRAVSAALLTAFVALKDGDRVGLFGFDSKPRAARQPISGARAFATLQRVAAGIDYSASETNYALALATLTAELQRRSLIIVFTEFTDTINAELMLNAVGTLLKRHLVLFVVLRDEELEGFAAAEPAEPEDVSRAVTAASLLRERRLVITRLRHLGVHVVEAPGSEAGPALVNAYLDLKRRSLL